MKKFCSIASIVVTLLTLAACGSKDALAGTWSPNLAQTVRSHGHSTEAANAPWKMLI